MFKTPLACAALLLAAGPAAAVSIDISSISFGSTGPLDAEDVADTELLLNTTFTEQAPPAPFEVNFGNSPVTRTDILFINVLGETDVNDDVTDDLREVPFLGSLALNGGPTIDLTGHTVGLITTQNTPLGPQPFERGIIRFDAPVVVNVGGELVQVKGIDTEYNRGAAVLGAFTGLSTDTTGPAFGAFVPFEFSVVPEPGSAALLGVAGLIIARRRRQG